MKESSSGQISFRGRLALLEYRHPDAQRGISNTRHAPVAQRDELDWHLKSKNRSSKATFAWK